MSISADRTAVPTSVTTPDRADTSLGSLEFNDGYPTPETAERLRDHLDHLHGVEAFMNSIQGDSTYALREGFRAAGVQDGDVLIWSELMDSASIFLTANADTVYFCAFFDLTDGPLVMDTPSDTLGIIDDMWFRWITDFGLPGADRGQGGTYLLVGPGYDGTLPEGGHYVRHSRTNRVLMLGRAFIDQNPDNDPAPTAQRIKEQLRVYPYAPGGVGSSIGAYMTGRGSLGALGSPASPRFAEGTGLAFNTVPPNDFGHYEMLDALVQLEPASGARRRAGRAVRRHRDRQGRDVRPRPSAARHPRRRRGRRERRVAHPRHGSPPQPRASATTRTATLRGGTCSSRAGSTSPTPRRWSRRTGSSPSPTRGRVSCTGAPGSSTPRRGSPRPCACA